MITVRIKFKKVGLASYFSHLDLQRVMARAFKKSGLPVWYSQGYNPHIYMTFSLPLSLGQESICESVDFRLNEPRTSQEILDAMEGTLPQGIELFWAGAPDYEAGDIRWAKYQITVYGNTEKTIQALDLYEQDETAVISKPTKKKGTKEINLKEFIKDIRIIENQENQVVFTAIFPAGLQFNINPSLFLEYLNLKCQIPVIDANILRVQLFNENLDILQ